MSPGKRGLELLPHVRAPLQAPCAILRWHQRPGAPLAPVYCPGGPPGHCVDLNVPRPSHPAACTTPTTLHRTGSPVLVESIPQQCANPHLRSRPGCLGAGQDPSPPAGRAPASGWMDRQQDGLASKRTKSRKKLGRKGPLSEPGRARAPRQGGVLTGQGDSEGLPRQPGQSEPSLPLPPAVQLHQSSPSSSAAPAAACRRRHRDGSCRERTSQHRPHSPRCSASRSLRPLSVL